MKFPDFAGRPRPTTAPRVVRCPRSPGWEDTLRVPTRLRTPLVAAAVAVTFIAGQAPAPVAAATPADRVIAVATSKLGAPWRYGASGPYAFDCSGLVIYSFTKAGYASKIGYGRYRSAYSLYRWFKGRGLASRTGGRRGDLVVWGGGSHIGIYLGNGRAISTLRSGVRIHGIYAVTASFTAFLHTGMSTTAVTTTAAAPAPAPTPTPIPTGTVILQH